MYKLLVFSKLGENKSPSPHQITGCCINLRYCSHFRLCPKRARNPYARAHFDAINAHPNNAMLCRLASICFPMALAQGRPQCCY
jgi:hypothetical protein